MSNSGACTSQYNDIAQYNGSGLSLLVVIPSATVSIYCRVRDVELTTAASAIFNLYNQREELKSATSINELENIEQKIDCR